MRHVYHYSAEFYKKGKKILIGEGLLESREPILRIEDSDNFKEDSDNISAPIKSLSYLGVRE